MFNFRAGADAAPHILAGPRRARLRVPGGALPHPPRRPAPGLPGALCTNAVLPTDMSTCMYPLLCTYVSTFVYFHVPGAAGEGGRLGAGAGAAEPL
eukprot:883430-Prorocentrum_minimum.AAC.2